MRAWKMGRDISGDEQTLGFQGRLQINCELPTRLRVMGFNVMPCVILDTHGHFSFAIYQPPRNGFVLDFLLFIHEFWGCPTSWKIRITIVGLIIFIKICQGLVLSQETSLNFGTYMEEWMRAAKMCSSRREDITI